MDAQALQELDRLIAQEYKADEDAPDPGEVFGYRGWAAGGMTMPGTGGRS